MNLGFPLSFGHLSNRLGDENLWRDLLRQEIKTFEIFYTFCRLAAFLR